MLYATTRDNHDAYTAHKALTENRAPDGGFYVPFRMPQYSLEEIESLKQKSFGQCVAEVLNQLFGTTLTAWDVECTIGRSCARINPMTQRIVVAEVWHNLDWNFKSTVSGILSLLTEEKIPSDWAMIGIRIAVLFGLFGKLMRKGLVDMKNPMDIAVMSGDFSAPMAAWYARQMGLPIANIICGCADNSPAWDLLHLGTVKTEGDMPAFLEQLICETLGHKEAQRYGEVCADGGVYSLLPVEAEKLRRGMFAGVVSQDRVETLISNVYNTDAYILGPKASIAYGGLLDYRAKTGANRLALLLAERSPVCDGDLVAKAMGISKSELREKLQ